MLKLGHTNRLSIPNADFINSAMLIKPTINTQVLQISRFGGKPNLDITKAFISAWTQACASTTAVKIVIPAGTYNMGVIDLKGPCKAPIEIKVDGTIKAPANPDVLKNAY
ncbi:hypothetical protein VNO77_21765 [Canavalia gladiata]|uniref:Polygalacturonase n=1 Tax=Canavalia gladiata TaxID=3824 RepID=A0AAN9QDW6_CANGL